MTDAIFSKLTSLADLADLGGDALLTILATTIDGLGKVTDFSGAQIEKLGEMEQALADIVRTARGA
jgi:hypothetical protein